MNPIFLTLIVLKLDKSIYSNSVHPSNILSILVTSSVKTDINSIFFKDEQLLKILLISFNFSSIIKYTTFIPNLSNLFLKIKFSFLFIFNIFIFDSMSSFIISSYLLLII